MPPDTKTKLYKRIILYTAPFFTAGLATLLVATLSPATTLLPNAPHRAPAIPLAHCTTLYGLTVCEVSHTPHRATKPLSRSNGTPNATDRATTAKNPSRASLYGTPSQYQKDTIATACKAHFNGVEASKCYYRLLGLAFRESSFDCSREGDHRAGVPRSHGCYQIRTDLPGRPDPKTAQDFAYATKWTLTRLLAYGYATDPYRAIQAHNGLTLRNPDGTPRPYSEAFAYAMKVREVAAYYERNNY